MINHITVPVHPFHHLHSKSYKHPLSEINTADPVFHVKTLTDGSKQAYYHINLIDLLDHVFVWDAMEVFSIDQERFFRRYFNQAHEVYEKLDYNNIHDEEQWLDPYENMDELLIQLDDFIGSYKGV